MSVVKRYNWKFIKGGVAEATVKDSLLGVATIFAYVYNSEFEKLRSSKQETALPSAFKFSSWSWYRLLKQGTGRV